MLMPLRRAWTIEYTAMLVILLAAAIWIHRAPFQDMIAIGVRDREQSHILLAPLVACWLAWLRRSRLRSLRVAPSLWGPTLVLIGGVMSWWGAASDTQIAWHAGALMTLLGAMTCLTGLEPVRRFAPAFAALLFFIPIPGLIRQSIAIPLQNMATEIVQVIVDLVGVPATHVGSVLIINGEQVAVGEACNGMRMVFALAIVVYAFAFSVPLRPTVRAALLAVSPLVALVVNVIRLVPTSVVFAYGSPAQAQAFHDLSGWIALPIALAVLVWLLRMMKWLDLPVASMRLAARI